MERILDVKLVKGQSAMPSDLRVCVVAQSCRQSPHRMRFIDMWGVKGREVKLVIDI